MDLVYTYRKEEHNAIELRYSLRSFLKHLKGLDNVYIVGDDPGIFKNVIHIPFPDKHINNLARNIYEKIRRACQEKSLSEDFLYCADDILLMKDYQASFFPYYYCCTFEEELKTLSKNNNYKAYVENTYNLLLERNLPTVYFNGHTPIIYNKETYQSLMGGYDWECKKGFISKSLYANTLKVPGVFLKDIKINTPKTKPAIHRILNGASIFSTDYWSINDEMREVLQEVYPEPFFGEL